MKRLGQSTIEFAVLIAIVVAALLAMQIYLRRGLSGSLKESADQLGSPYDPRHTQSDITVNYTGTTTTNVYSEEEDDTTYIYTNVTYDETTSRSGTQNMEGYGGLFE